MMLHLRIIDINDVIDTQYELPVADEYPPVVCSFKTAYNTLMREACNGLLWHSLLWDFVSWFVLLVSVVVFYFVIRGLEGG